MRYSSLQNFLARKRHRAVITKCSACCCCVVIVVDVVVIVIGGSDVTGVVTDNAAADSCSATDTAIAAN